MSLSLFVVMALAEEPNTNELNVAAQKNNVEIVFHQNVALKQHSGLLPIKYKQHDTGVEFYVIDDPKMIKALMLSSTIKIEEAIVYQLRFGADAKQGAAAFAAAYTLNATYGGVVIEGESATSLDATQLLQAADAFFNMPAFDY